MKDGAPEFGDIVEDFVAHVAAYASIAALTLVLATGVVLVFREDREHDRCPQAEVRLNPLEYELQRRRCEAVRHGALELAERR